ncbi:hypothetical protein Gogos_000453 [Gossypium gossypioides]|uniref:RNase H type-1 domain-containing protein n=1 Tax=Gossypium gossypioides TaxID=34282 RepID=A0A7J9CSV3_GOSGO|nr:hypothetical protein [Gossypium gossypioides]
MVGVSGQPRGEFWLWTWWIQGYNKILIYTDSLEVVNAFQKTKSTSALMPSKRKEDLHVFVDAPERLEADLCADRTNDFLTYDELI